MSITVEQIMAHDPCKDYPEERVRRLISEGKTPLEILDLPIPAEDRIWVLTRSGMLPSVMQHEFALRCAEDALLIWEQYCPGDTRPRVAIETKRRWLGGEATDEELAAASGAAWAAERDAASATTRAAALAAALAATAEDAAENAVWDAALAAASAGTSVVVKARLIVMLREIIGAKERRK